MDESEMQDPETWDRAHVQRHAPADRARAVVSVAFARAEFEAVTAYAARLGVPVSRAIRDAVLEKLAAESSGVGAGAPGDSITYVNTPHPTNLSWSDQTANIGEPGGTRLAGHGTTPSAG